MCIRDRIGDTANSDVENNNNNNDNNNNSKEMLLVNELERVKEDLITTKRSEEMIKRAIEEQRNEYVKLQADYKHNLEAVSYTHLRAHETPEHLVCRLLLEKKKKKK